MIIKEACYELSEHQLKELLEYKKQYVKDTYYQTPNPSNWEYADNFSIEEELKYYTKLPKVVVNNYKIV